MSTKLKIFGLGVLAVFATSAVAAMNAAAETGGHFTSTETHTAVFGYEGESHHIHFVKEGGSDGERIGCEEDLYSGTFLGSTVTEIGLSPQWETCRTTSGGAHFEVHENKCVLRLTIGKNIHNTVHLECPTGQAVDITHPNCTIRVPPQTMTGVSYDSDGGKWTYSVLHSERHKIAVRGRNLRLPRHKP